MRLIFLSGAMLFFSACASSGGARSAQRSAQVRVYKSVDYEKLFHAFKKVFQWEGYQIKVEDMGGGLLTGSIHRSDSGAALALDLGGGKKNYQGDLFELSANFLRPSPQTVEIRISLQKISHYSLGSDQGEEIQDDQFYNGLYKKVKQQMDERKPQSVLNSKAIPIKAPKRLPAAVSPAPNSSSVPASAAKRVAPTTPTPTPH